MLHSKFPEISYWRFVASSVLRFSMGYLFLANVVVVLVLAENVLEIFFDVLALQFLQQLDDIAFSVSKIDVMGRHMYLATRVSGSDLSTSWIRLLVHCAMLNYLLAPDFLTQNMHHMNRHLILQLVSKNKKIDWVLGENSECFSRGYTSLISFFSWQ